jgi:hypothetical protein
MAGTRDGQKKGLGIIRTEPKAFTMGGKRPPAAMEGSQGRVTSKCGTIGSARHRQASYGQVVT